MELYPDFKELLELLNGHEVDYLIVGGYALALHGHPRFTGDLDIYLGIQRNNARKVIAVLKEFGFGSLNLKNADRNHEWTQIDTNAFLSKQNNSDCHIREDSCPFVVQNVSQSAKRGFGAMCPSHTSAATILLPTSARRGVSRIWPMSNHWERILAAQK